MKKLGVFYYGNKEAWMTTNISEGFIRNFNSRMKRQNQYVILWTDNAPCHCAQCSDQCQDSLSSTNYFSKITTSRYRQYLQKFIIGWIDCCVHASELSRKVSVEEVINWVVSAWNDVKPTAISKSFFLFLVFQSSPMI